MFTPHSLKTPLALALMAALGACGGGSEPPSSVDATASVAAGGPTATAQRVLSDRRDGGGLRDRLPDLPDLPGLLDNQVERLSVAGFPHEVDVYRPKNATRIIVFLHGGGGTKEAIAYQMGLKLTPDGVATVAGVQWRELEAAGVIAVFPQGQTSAGNARTWNNHTMVSGQDDQAFLQSLAATLRSRYGLNDVAVAGHSMGGAMVNRMWCESPATFNAYVSISGPASAFYLQTGCPRGGQAPYRGVFGSADPVIQGQWEATTWAVNPSVVAMQPAAFVDPTMVGEWLAFQYRAQAMCGETPTPANAMDVGGSSVWSACGDRLQVGLATGAGHDSASISATLGLTPFQLVNGFVANH